MIQRLLNLTTVGLLVIALGIIVASFTISFSQKNERFLNDGITREGRIISRQNSTTDSQHILRVQADLSPHPDQVLIRIVEVPVPPETFDKSPVGAKVPLLILSGDPPLVRLKVKTEEASFTAGYIFATAMVALGTILIWVHRRKTQPDFIRTPSPPQRLRKISTKTLTLYDGAFEFSYAEEKNRIILADSTSIRINQYRPLSELSSALPDDDLLQVLRSAKSDWQIPDKLTGREALTNLVTQKKITGADQFFINGEHLGLLFRDEIDSGHWSSWVRGVWQMSPLGNLLTDLLSSAPDRARRAAEEVLYREDTSSLTPLAHHAKIIQRAATGSHDDREMIHLAAELLGALREGICSCQIYTNTSRFSPDILIDRKKVKESKDDSSHDLACQLCTKTYTVTTKIRAGQALFHWQEKSIQSRNLTKNSDSNES